MNTLKNLNDAVKYIEKNLCGDIDTNELAHISGTSADSFSRFFSYMTGMAVSEYIRRRRMTVAADMLNNPDIKVIDVAVQLGYDSPDAFSRAFARQHGIRPTEYRKNGGNLRILPPASFHIMIKGAKEMNFSLIDISAAELIGISRLFDGEKCYSREALRHEMWTEEFEDIPGKLASGEWNQMGNNSYDGTWYGIWRNGRYAIARTSREVSDKSLEKIAINPGTYASFQTEKGGMAWEELPKLFSLIFESWLPTSDYIHSGDDIIEVYHLWADYDRRKKERYYEVWIPVTKKS